jgi:MFS family permease
MLLAGIGIAQLSETFEMGSVAPMHTALARAFGLSDVARAALPALALAGNSIGLAISGPLCDRWGRKSALVCSVVAIGMVMAVTAILPRNTGVVPLLALRFLGGVAGAVQIPAGLLLAVESAPQEVRTKLSFGISVVSSLGYLLEAVGIRLLMPHFGEAPSDSWRGFCALTACLAFLSLPFVAALRESPLFLAVRGDAEGCVSVLDTIARFHRKPELHDSSRVDVTVESSEKQASKGFFALIHTFWIAITSYALLIGTLTLVDMGRSFFTSGSSYLWKDLFENARSAHSIEPTTLNIIASLSPILGLAIGLNCLSWGVYRICFSSSLVAAVALAFLTLPSVRHSPQLLLLLVIVAKMTYGPLGSCVSLMKAEAFPTEIRGCVFSLISTMARLLCIVAPTLIEALKEDERAASWSSLNLRAYIVCLIVAVLICGFLSMRIPSLKAKTSLEDGPVLEDYLEEESCATEAPGRRPRLGEQEGGRGILRARSLKPSSGGLKLVGSYGSLGTKPPRSRLGMDTFQEHITPDLSDTSGPPSPKSLPLPPAG